MKTLRRILLVLGNLVLTFWALWGFGAIYFNLPGGTLGKIAATLALTAGIIGAWSFNFRFRWYLRGATVAILAAITFYFGSLTPEKCFAHTVWQKSWARTPTVEFNGSQFTLHDLRDFHYRSTEDFDAIYRDADYDLDKVQTLDIAVSHWDGMESIAHTMLSFGFADGKYLAFSAETRLPEGVEQGFLGGIYKQYELLMIAATEQDLFGLRTNFRGEELYLYRTNATPQECKMILAGILKRLNEIAQKPKFYHSLNHNCTTSLAPILFAFAPESAGDLRLLANGWCDELLFDLNILARRQGETFPQLKSRSLVNQYLTTPPSDYSAAIRQGMK